MPLKIFTNFFVFWLLSRKLLEILEPIIALEAGCESQIKGILNVAFHQGKIFLTL